MDWKPGDLVLVYMPTERKGVPKKRLMQWSTLAKIVERKTFNSWEVQRPDKKTTEVFNVDRLFKMPPGTTVHSLKPDSDDELLGVFEIPADAEARKTALEKRRARRDQARQAADGKLRDADPPPEEKEAKSEADLLKERVDDIRSTMRGPAALKLDDLCLYRSGRTKRWLLGKVLSWTGRGLQRKVTLHLYWKRLKQP